MWIRQLHPPRSRVASLMLLIMHWPIFSSEERERERESGVTAIGWPPSAIGSVYRRSITTTVPVTALSALRPCSTVTRVDLGIDYPPHVRWLFSKNHFPRFCSGIQCILITIEVSAQSGMRNACCVWYTTPSNRQVFHADGFSITLSRATGGGAG